MLASVLEQPAVRPTGAALGADVTGIAMPRPSLDDIRVIKDALRDHLVVRIRGTAMDDVAFTEFAAHFGELEGSPEFSRSRAVYIPEAPLVTIISNIAENGKQIGEHGDQELNWHSDKGFVDYPSGYTFLLAREIPPSGGNTGFANMFNAYERLPEDLKRKIARLRLKHQESHTAQGARRPGYRDIETDDPRELPGPLHPVVRTHPESKRKALYLGRRFGSYIPGFTLRTSDELVDTLWAATAHPEDVWTQVWREGDLVIWDNRSTMHRRDAFVGQGRRRMHRLTTIGERPF